MTPNLAPVTVWRELRPVPPHGTTRRPVRPRYLPHLCTTWTLPGHWTRTPAAARASVRTVCHTWKVPRPTTADLVLITSELVTNAVKHAKSDTIRMTLRLSERHVWLTVTDDGPRKRRIAPRQPHPDEEGGRGLALVEALATRCVIEPADAGTRVWVCLALPEPSTPQTTTEDTTDADAHQP